MGYKKTDPCISKAFDDERLFVLMTRDPKAPEVVIEWIKQSLRSQPKEKLHEALDAAIEMVSNCKKMNERKKALEMRESGFRRLFNRLSFVK